jgi:hypothetical protein
MTTSSGCNPLTGEPGLRAIGSRVEWTLDAPKGYQEYLHPFIGEAAVAELTHAVENYGVTRVWRERCWRSRSSTVVTGRG